MIPKETLTDVEQKVLASFRAGTREVPAKGEVRGDFLRSLFTGYYDRDKADYRGTVIIGAIISDVLDMEFCDAKLPMRFRDCSFNQEITLQQLKCQELDFSGCILKKGLDTRKAKVTGSMDLTKVKAMDRVWLAGADIGRQLSCTGGSFQNKEGSALNAQGIKVAETVFLHDGFNAEGEVSLAGADIGGQLNCQDGSFQNKNGNALNAQNIKVAAGVFLRGEFRAEGAVWLVGAEIRGQLDCTGGSFQNEGSIALNARNIKVANEVIIRNFSATGRVSFDNATIEGSLVLDNCELTHLSLAGANVSGEFQDDAKVYKKDQGGDIDLDIDGFRYQRLNAAKEKINDRLAWVGLMSKKGDEFRPQPYEQLTKVYRATGYTNEAREVGFALEQKRQEKMKRGWWKGWYEVLRLTIGYGYKPYRFLWWFFGIILSGTVFSGMPCSLESWHSPVTGITVEASRNHWTQCEFLRMHPTHVEVVYPENGQPREIQRLENYPRLIPFLYAAETAFPLFPLGQTGNWHPATWWVKFIQWLITVIGTVVLAIMVFYGAGLLGPRWRDE